MRITHRQKYLFFHMIASICPAKRRNAERNVFGLFIQFDFIYIKRGGQKNEAARDKRAERLIDRP